MKRYLLTALGVALIGVLLATLVVSCSGSDETDYTASFYKSLFQRISELEQRVDALEEAVWSTTTTSTTVPSTTTTKPPTTTTRSTTTTTTKPTTTTTQASTTTTQSTTTTTVPPSSFNLQQALNAASSGSTVVVPSGTYTGPFTISGKNLTLRGPATIRGSGSRQEILYIANCNVTLEGITVQGDYADTDQIGVYFKNAGGTVKNCTFRDVGYSGIVGFPALGLDVVSSSFTHSGDFGVHTKDGSNNVRVLNSTFSGFASRLYPGHGIYFSNSTNCTATGNTISDVQGLRPGINEISGIKFAHSTGSATGNTITDSVAGISVPGGYNLTVADNIIRNTSERGVYLLAGAHDVTVTRNTISMTRGTGILCSHYSTWPHDCTITNNQVTAPTPYSPGSSTGFVELGNSWEGL